MTEKKKKDRRTFLKGIATAGVATSLFALKPFSAFGQQKHKLNARPAPDPNEKEDDISPEMESLYKAAMNEAGDAIDKVIEGLIKAERTPSRIDIKGELAKAGFQLRSSSALAHARVVTAPSSLLKKRDVARTRGWHWHICPFYWCFLWHSHASW